MCFINVCLFGVVNTYEIRQKNFKNSNPFTPSLPTYTICTECGISCFFLSLSLNFGSCAGQKTENKKKQENKTCQSSLDMKET